MSNAKTQAKAKVTVNELTAEMIAKFKSAQGAKAKGNGVRDIAREVLTEAIVEFSKTGNMIKRSDAIAEIMKRTETTKQSAASAWHNARLEKGLVDSKE